MLKRFENALMIVALLFCAGAFLPLFSDDQPVPDAPVQNSALSALTQQAKSSAGDPTKAEPLRLAAQVGVYGSLLLLLWIRRRDVFEYMRETKLLWALVGFCFLSVLWSDLPGFAFRRSLFMLATSMLGLYLAVRYTPRQFMRLLGVTLIIAAFFSAVVALKYPDLGVDPTFTNNSWRGIFGQKNTLGRLMVLGVMANTFVALDSRKLRRWLYAAGALLCAGLALMSKSATSAVMIPVLGLMVYAFDKMRSRSAWQVATVVVGISLFAVCGLFLFMEPSEIFNLLGRDATLSGRVDIWSLVIPRIMQHPWLGYGYASFWVGYDASPSAAIWDILQWHVPHSHNGFLDLVEQVGFIGTGLFFAGFAVAIQRGFRWARVNQTILGLWPLAYLSFTFWFNMTEGSILRQDNLFWVLYVTTWVAVVVRTNAMETVSGIRSPHKPGRPVLVTKAEPGLGLVGAG